MKKLDTIRLSDDMRRLAELTSEEETLKWKLVEKVEKACRVYGNLGEDLTAWEKRLDALEQFLESNEVQAEWYQGNMKTKTNTLGFLQFEVHRCRRTIDGHRAGGLTEVPDEGDF